VVRASSVLAVAVGTAGITKAVDTATNLFTPTGRLGTARFLHTATRLNNGQVLITGGQLRTNPTPLYLNSAELYK
jgi:hypothetical protein